MSAPVPPQRAGPAGHPAGHLRVGPGAGHAAVTIEGVAARAGVGKQTIYRWWPSKGILVLEAFR